LPTVLTTSAQGRRRREEVQKQGGMGQGGERAQGPFGENKGPASTTETFLITKDGGRLKKGGGIGAQKIREKKNRETSPRPKQAPCTPLTTRVPTPKGTRQGKSNRRKKDGNKKKKKKEKKKNPPPRKKKSLPARTNSTKRKKKEQRVAPPPRRAYKSQILLLKLKQEASLGWGKRKREKFQKTGGGKTGQKEI